MSSHTPMSNIPPLGPPTGMMPGAAASKFKPIDPVRVLRANWLWIVLAGFIGVLVGGGSYYLTNKFFPRFTSEATFDVQATNFDANGRSTGPVRMAELEPIILGEVQTLLSEPILRQTLNRPSVQNTAWFEKYNDNIELALEDLEEKVLSAGHIRDTPRIRATAKTPGEDDAQIILTALRDVYIEYTTDEVNRESEREMDAAVARLNTAEERITAVTSRIARFLETTPLEALDERSSEAALQVNRLVFNKGELENSYNSLKAQYDQLLERQQRGDFEPSDEERQQIEFSQEIIQVDGQLRQLRVARDSQLDKFGPQHETIRQIDQQILALERERKKEFDEQARNLFNAKLEQAALGQQILEQELADVANSLAEWTVKRQEFVRLKNQYDTMVREQEQAEVERENANTAIQTLIELENRDASKVVVRSQVPPQRAKKSWPPDWYIMIPVVAVLFTAMVTGLIFLRELMDQRVRSAADVKMIPDASLVGMIPNAGEDRGAGKSIERVVETQPAGLLAESFRQVRTAVLSKMDRRGYKTLMLVSAKAGAGVTAITQNLGASCALSGRRVLVVDANFRRPGLAKLTGVAQGPGLADVLRGDHDVGSAGELAQQTQTQGLSVLPAGSTQGAAVELFESPRFRELLGRLEAEYDLLIIDAPPALLTSDAQLLTKHVDAMVLVSRARNDTRGMLQRLYREMDGQRADILGVVLNGVQAAAGGYLKRNFREFHAYSGPERRSGSRKQAPAPAPGNGKTAEANGNGRAAQAPEPTPVALDADPDEGDDDVFGGFDLTDDQDDQDK